MRSFVFSLLLVCFLSYPQMMKAQEQEPQHEKSLYERRIEGHYRFWNHMIPKYSKVQFAGSIGVLSMGPGWSYGKNHWETDILFGLVPRNSNRRAMLTFTLKQNYIPWFIKLHEKVVFEPLSTGVYFNTLLDRDFWFNSPDKYPKGYYFFSTKLRTHIFVGERITIKLNEKWLNKSLTFFYELSTCDLYVITAIGNKVLKPKDYLSLSFGLKLQIL